MIGGFFRKNTEPRRVWKADKTWFHSAKYPARSALNGSPVVEMTFGYYGEIFCTFADGERTCVWPTGEVVPPNCQRLTRDSDAAEGGDAKAAPVPQDQQARAEGIAQVQHD